MIGHWHSLTGILFPWDMNYQGKRHFSTVNAILQPISAKRPMLTASNNKPFISHSRTSTSFWTYRKSYPRFMFQFVFSRWFFIDACFLRRQSEYQTCTEVSRGQSKSSKKKLAVLRSLSGTLMASTFLICINTYKGIGIFHIKDFGIVDNFNLHIA